MIRQAIGADMTSRISQGEVADPVTDYEVMDHTQPTPTAFGDRVIDTLPESKFRLKYPIPVRLDGSMNEGWVASFEEADIAISGDTVADAIEALSENIVFAMELHISEEDQLNEHFRGILAVFRRYIEVRDDQ